MPEMQITDKWQEKETLGKQKLNGRKMYNKHHIDK